MKERRRNPRFKITQPARLKISSADSGDTHAEVEALVHDAAIDGVLVVTRRVILVGTEVEVTVLMPYDM